MTEAADGWRPDVPSAARMYDYYLGGKDNYPADRSAAERIIAAMPDGVVRTAAVENRKFLMRAVRYLTQELGVRQFLDIGAGLPTMNSVHQVAQAIAPESRVVYVDHDPTVRDHSRSLLHGNNRATVIRRDLRDPASILADPGSRRLLDLSQPVAVLLVAILHFIPADDDPHGVVRTLMKRMPTGSYLVVSHFTADSYTDQADEAAEGYENASSSVHPRSKAEVAKFFDGYDLLDPGELVWAPRWRRDADGPEDDPQVAADPGRSLSWCGIARKTRPAGLAGLSSGSAWGGDVAPGASGPRLTSLGSPTSINPDSVAPRARLDPETPNVARMYDYYLGGKDNYPADRVAAERIIGMMPDGVVRTSAVQNRKFLMRVVRHLAEDLGVRQYLDIGAGLPTMNSVHQVAQAVEPDSRVVYVDNDPIVLAHSRNLLHGNDHATVIQHDLREATAILGDPQLREMLDLSQPVAVLLVAVLHFMPDTDDPLGVVRELMAPLPPGSHLVITHFTADSYAQADVAAQEYDSATSTLHSRHRSQVAEFFDGYELLAPGEIVWTPQWRRDVDEPEEDPEVAADPGRSLFWCGVGRKL